ncbi:MAG: hypothetical protein ACJATI_001344 [Halioglobus sp.]|jgi:hypothetical protein
MEVGSFLYMAVRLKYISIEQFEKRKPNVGKLSNKINAFHKRLDTNK